MGGGAGGADGGSGSCGRSRGSENSIVICSRSGVEVVIVA